MNEHIASLVSAIDNALSFANNEGFDVPASNIREDGNLELYAGGKEYLAIIVEKP